MGFSISCCEALKFQVLDGVEKLKARGELRAIGLALNQPASCITSASPISL